MPTTTACYPKLESPAPFVMKKSLPLLPPEITVFCRLVSECSVLERTRDEKVLERTNFAKRPAVVHLEEMAWKCPELKRFSPRKT